MMIRWITALTIATALATPMLAQNTANTNMDILRQKIKSDKKLVVAQNLQLTDAEGAAFWPVYDAYQTELQKINQRIAATVKAYATAYNKGPIDNETAKKLLEESVAIDEAEAKLKSTTVPKVMKVLPAMKAARYIQIENKIRALVRYELADNIPLVE
jgi:hypothetical protein